MRVEWDEAKRKANLRKHGVEFADALSVLDDPRPVTIEDRDHDEQRFVTLGLDASGNLRVVVYTYRGAGHDTPPLGLPGRTPRTPPI